MPGVGDDAHQLKDYFKETGLRYLDVVLLVFSSRISVDAALYLPHEIRSKECTTTKLALSTGNTCTNSGESLGLCSGSGAERQKKVPTECRFSI